MDSRSPLASSDRLAREVASSGVDFRLLFQASPDPYLVLDRELRIAAVNDAYLRATMTARGEIVGRSIFDVFPDNPADLGATGTDNLGDSLRRVLTQRVSDTMAVQKYDIRRPPEAGGEFEERYWSPVNHPVFDCRGDLVYILHRAEDVTEFVRLKQRGKELQALTAELKSHGAQMEEEIYLRAQEIQDANRGLRDAKQELEERVRERTEELACANQALRSEIEQSRRLEEQIRRAQKMEAFGQLAGGIAHDFNNLLTAINGFSELLLAEVIPPTGQADYLREIRNAGERAAALTRQLLAFSRKQVLQPVALDLNVLLDDLSRMLHRLIGADVELRTVFDPTLGPVRVDPGQIEQVILNLVVNARDAMPAGGQLTIATRNVDGPRPPQPHLGNGGSEGYVQLEVRDDGVGMDAATRAKIFEPFFTTKPPGEGTGLGLAVVHGIVRQSGGTIDVESEPGRGTTFRIGLPRVAETTALAGARFVREPMPTGTETILLVDDESLVRETARIALEAVGYVVLIAADGEAAWRCFEEHPGVIDLLISDVVMPRMSGRQLVERIRERHRGTRILYMSGYTDDAIVWSGIDAGVPFLQKPLTPSNLCRKVREVLDARVPH